MTKCEMSGWYSTQCHRHLFHFSGATETLQKMKNLWPCYVSAGLIITGSLNLDLTPADQIS